MKKCMSSMSRSDTVQLWKPRIAYCSGTPYSLFQGLRLSESSSTSSNVMPHSGCTICMHLLAEPFVALGDLHLRLGEALRPEVVRALGHGVADHPDLAGARLRLAAGAAPREGGGQVAGRAHLITEIQVIDRLDPVVQQRALHETQAQRLDEEVHVALCRAGAQRDVVQALNSIGHRVPLAAMASPASVAWKPIASPGTDERKREYGRVAARSLAVRQPGSTAGRRLRRAHA